MNNSAKRKILLVDDEQHWRDKVRTSLANAGFDVLSASDGSEAMARAADPDMGLMIVDEDLAGESGLMLSRFLRRNHPGVPTVIFTDTKQAVGKNLEMRRQVADQCVTKDCVEELVAKVGTYLG